MEKNYTNDLEIFFSRDTKYLLKPYKRTIQLLKLDYRKLTKIIIKRSWHILFKIHLVRQRHVIPRIIQTDRENAVEKYINLDGLANIAENYARIILENRPKTCLRMDTVAATQIENDLKPGPGFQPCLNLFYA